MKTKKVVAVAAATLMAASSIGVLAGCGKDRAHTIDIFLLANDSETQFYDKYFEDLEAELQEEGLDYAITFNGEQESNYYDALKSAINRGDTPDIFYVRPNELLQYKDVIVSLQNYAEGAGKEFADLDDIYDTALDMYRFDPATGALGNPEDDLYAFPKDLSTQQLGYNRSLVEKYQQHIKAAGIAKLPWEMDWTKENYTWEQYKTMCKAIADHAEENNYACDIPSVEILAKSFGGELIDLSEGRANGKVSSLTSGAMQKAIKYQAELVDCGAANYSLATYSNFSAGRVCFYGLVGSWEIADYNRLLNKGNWEVMPWPTEDGSTDWYGTITSAGYVVSKACDETVEKGDIAKRIAISFMSSRTQTKLVREAQISLPLIKSWADDYKSAANDDTYSPKSRGIFLDVISGEHGFFPAKYSTYDKIWLDKLDDQLTIMWNEGKGKAVAKFNSITWADVQKEMQDNYDTSKNS